MVGHTEYEFCAVGIFITQGNPRLLRLFLSAYGYTTAALTPAFSRRMMALLLLHRYSNLRWFRNRAAGMAEMANLQQMEQYWFGLDG